MAVKLRLTRVGSKKNPIYRVVAADSRSPRDGKFLEIVGRYNPQTEPSLIELDEDKVTDWLGKGAQPTEAVARLLKVKGIARDGRAARVSRARARRRSGCGAGGDARSATARSCSQLHVAPDDVGKVIGRGGRIVRALRTVVRAGAVRDGPRACCVEIVE